MSIKVGCMESDKIAMYVVNYEWKRGKLKCMNPGKAHLWKLLIWQVKLSLSNIFMLMKQCTFW